MVIQSNFIDSSDGIIVETKAYYPEEATEIWQEWYFENWYYSKLIEVKCTNSKYIYLCHNSPICKCVIML